MNFDANPFACYEPNTTGGTEDRGGDFDLAGAAGRAARTGSVFGGSGQGTASSQFPPPWPGLGMDPHGPTFRGETQTDPTVPPLPEEEGGEATVEPEDPSAKLLRRVLAEPANQTFRESNLRECELRQDLEVCRQPMRGETGSRSD